MKLQRNNKNGVLRIKVRSTNKVSVQTQILKKAQDFGRYLHKLNTDFGQGKDDDLRKDLRLIIEYISFKFSRIQISGIHLAQLLGNPTCLNYQEYNFSGIQLSQILMNTSCSSFEEYVLLKLSGMKIIRNTSCSNERRLCLNSSLLEWSRHHNIQNVFRFQHVLNILDVCS